MRAFYFTYFATFGIVVPFFALYYESLGLNSFQISVLTAITPLVRPVFAAAWTYPAERLAVRHAATVLACTLTAACLALYFIPSTFGGLAIVTLLLALANAPSLAFVEALTLEDAPRTGVPYGRVRLWGSLGFIAASWGFGVLLAYTPIRTALAAALLFAVLNAASSITLPRPAAAGAASRTSLGGFLARPGVVGFYGAAMLMQASHGAYYTFFSIHMAAQGRTGAVIGGLWALGVISEVVVLVFSVRLLDRVPASALLVSCFLLAAARWGLYATSASLVIAIPAQILHAFTYAAFHLAAVTATYRIFPEDLRASGQAIYGGVTYGMGSVVGMIAAGSLYDRIGPFRLFAVSALIALAGAVLIGRAARRIPGFDGAGAALNPAR